MDEYCPLCRKVGSYKKIRAVQLNYVEAVWLCEEEKCPWPFGYEEFRFTPRRIEELSTKYIPRTGSCKNKESTSISTELGVYTPPVTPSNESSSKDSGKIDNLNSSSPITYPFTGKVSPIYRSGTVLPIHSIKNENCQTLNENTSVSSIFDIDSSVPVGKIATVTIQQGRGSPSCNGKPIKKDPKPRILKRKMKPVPMIRCIETIPNNLVKIEVKEELLHNLEMPAMEISPSKVNCEIPRSVTATQGTMILQTSNLENFNLISDVPKTTSKVSNEIDEKITVKKNYDFSDQIAENNTLQSDNYLELMNLEGGNSAMDNSGQGSLNGIFEELLMENCQNVTQEIDDDWLKSMLM
ncbi:SUMO-specific isopeptidase USPL1 [Fopius arisanus]|uniref:SUMO-specific isopeptidase USPL1 n=1 Tax=Fopius arisanus TaxID=64838 RepID=A0A9R1U4P4_9HYME|nr:PREDICTED: SUMO-specific isopeptidase USPL1-like [Fopius arisanus]